ncbi:MAG: hypothetical protein ACREM2_02665 [Vulcanimicrobiaceae bacterium]
MAASARARAAGPRGSVTTPKPRPWIPPAGLLAGGVAHGVSWVLLFVLAVQGRATLSLPALAWLHLVALGWLTLIALSVLIHVIPTFTGIPLRAAQTARGALAVYAVAVAVLVAAFWNGAVALLPWATLLVVLALLVYLIPAARTLGVALRRGVLEAAIARALAVTLSFLALAALLGATLGWALAGRLPVALLGAGPHVHAALGLIGWLTILVMGVSTRTIGPIAGAGSRVRSIHIVVGSLQFLGVTALALGFAVALPAVVLLGIAAAVLGSLAYAANLFDVLRRATVPHRPPQAFLAAAAAWLLVGAAMVVATLAGASWGAAAIYVVLVGWVGQMVNGHLYHIGTRLIATMAGGDEDETRPGKLLTAPLSWASFALFQAAVGAGCIALVTSLGPLLAGAALCGLAAWIVMAANLALANRRARAAARLASGVARRLPRAAHAFLGEDFLEM